MLGVVHLLDLALPVERHLKAFSFFSLGNGINHCESWRVGPAGGFETEHAIVLHFLEKVHGLYEIVGGLSRKSDDDVGRERNLSLCGLDPADAFEVPVGGIFAGHHFQHARRAGLNRKMHVIAERRDGVDGFDDVAGEIAGVAGGEADAADAVHLADGSEQFGEAQLPFRIAVAVDVLAEELDLGVSLVGDTARLCEDRYGSAATLFASRVWNHAVGAEFVAALNDGDVSAVGILARSKFGFEGLVGLAVVETSDTVFAGFEAAEHFWQLAVGGRTGDERHIGRALEDLLALLLCDTPKHTEAFTGLVQLLVVVEAVENFLFGFVANGAGVVEDQARVFFRVYLAVAFVQQCANDLFGVMGIHLASERLKVEGFFGRHSKSEYRAFQLRKSLA